MLDANNITPLYRQLLDEIRSGIERGVYEPGEKLLTELEMAKKYGVSVVTARKATDELVRVGLVEKRRGKGTFVAGRKYSRDYTKILGFGEACRMQGLEPGSKLLARSVKEPTHKIREKLNLPDDATEVVYVSRLRYVNGEPIAIEENCFSMNYAFLLTENLDGSLFEVLRNRTGTEIRASRKTIEICRANAEESHLLEVKKRQPLLLVKSVAYGDDNAPIYCGTQIINGELYKLIV